MENRVKEIVEKFNMIKHPEGGYFVETYRSKEFINKESLNSSFDDKRNYSTSILFMLANGDVSHLHSIKSDETWHFYEGCGLEIIVMDENTKEVEVRKLGMNFKNGEVPQLVVEAGKIFGARLINKKSYCLVGCTVSPGFDFHDFKLYFKSDLLKIFGDEKKYIIEKMSL